MRDCHRGIESAFDPAAVSKHLNRLRELLDDPLLRSKTNDCMGPGHAGWREGARRPIRQALTKCAMRSDAWQPRLRSSVVRSSNSSDSS